MLYISAKYVNLKTGNTSLRKLKDNKINVYKGNKRSYSFA